MENVVVRQISNPLADDLDHVVAHTRALWEDVRGQRVFITGGTGFFGCWLLESFLWANEKLRLNASATVLTRDPASFSTRAPHLAHHPAVELHKGDVRSFEFPSGTFSHVVHAATPASAAINADDPVSMFEIIVLGTRRALELARRCRARRFLLASSGAVYGLQPADLTHLHEDYAGAPDAVDAGSAYAEGKRAAETLCAGYARQFGVHATIARCFAFVGPYLPLDVHFAAGNFIHDALAGGPIQVNSDGTAVRSYLYSADLAIWLWTILFHGDAMRPYNVGSADAVTIEALAQVVAQCFTPPLRVNVALKSSPNRHVHRYVPAVRRAETELGLRQLVPLSDAIARTIAWHERRSGPVRQGS
jgi:nucleoside-diphosphate-sugar epimerase